MENQRYPHPHPYLGTYGSRKRVHSDENSFDRNIENTTLIGNGCVAADSHRQIFSAQHGHQRRRTSQTGPVAFPLEPFLVPEEGYCVQGSLQLSDQDFLYSTTPRHLADNTGASSLYTQSYGLSLPLSDLNQVVQSQPLPFQNLLNTFRDMGSGGRRDQRLACFAMEDPIDSGSDESKTLRSSQSLSRTASLGSPHDLMLNTPNNVSRSVNSGSSYTFTMMGDLAENDTNEGLAVLGTHSPYDPFSENSQHQPWFAYGASDPQEYVSNQRPSLESIDEELLYGDLHLEPMDTTFVNPTQISFGSINVSQPSSEVPVGGYSNILQDPEPTSFVGLGFSFSGYEDLEDAGIGGAMVDVFDKQSPYSEILGPNSDKMRSFQTTTRDPTTSDLFTRLNRQASVETSHTMNHGPLTIQSSVPEERNHQTSDRDSVRPEAVIEWENSIVRNGAFRTLESHTISNRGTKEKKGRRNQPLSDEAKKKAAEVRRLKSCLHCWLKHLSCDGNQVCNNCRLRPSPYTSRRCLRTQLDRHVEYLFPEFVVARRGKAAIAKVIKDNAINFTGNEIQIQMSSGPHYPPITLTVCEFTLKNKDFLALYHAPANASSQSSQLTKVYGPPVGLSGSKIKIKDRIKDECKKHIREMTKHERFPCDATNGNAAPVSRKIFDAINCYRSSKPESANLELIRKAIRLLATHFFMRKIISFTQDSTQKVYHSLLSPWELPYDRNPSSKLLNYQIKREVHLLQRELTNDILQDLENEMRKKSRGLWVTCFSIIAILCMCIEAVELSIDGFIVQGLLTEGPGSNPEAREDGFYQSRILEEQLFNDLSDIFREIYQSGKFKKFHPIRDGATTNNLKELDQISAQFISKIHEIVKDNRDHLKDKAKNPTWNVEENLLLDHYRYRRENSGRLVAKFLLSFL